MTEMNLADLVLLTTGGEAEIYDLDPDRILRVLWRDNGKSEEKNVILQEILANESIHVPKLISLFLIFPMLARTEYVIQVNH